MDKLFLSVLNMSLTGAFVIAAICIVRLPLKKAPKIISYCLWAVVGFRLVFPFSVESVFSLIPFNAAPIPTNIALQPIPRINSGISFVNQAVGSVLPAAKPENSMNPLQAWTAIGAYVWLIGVAVMLVYSVVSIIRLKRRLLDAAYLRENICEANGLKTPLVIGLFHPTIYIPAGLSDAELTYILLHEQTHIRRRDHIIKMLAYFVLCLHWFNPFAWAAFLLMGADMEMSCDERVLQELGGDMKSDYSMSLVRIAAGRRVINGSPLAFGEGGIKERVKNVLNFQKPSRLMIVVAVVLVAVLNVGFALNRVNNQTIILPDITATDITSGAQATALSFGYSWYDGRNGAVADGIATWQGEYTNDNTLVLNSEKGPNAIMLSAEQPKAASYAIYLPDGTVYDTGTRELYDSLNLRLHWDWTDAHTRLVVEAPSEPGEYIYEVTIEWEENNLKATYGFKLIVSGDRSAYDALRAAWEYQINEKNNSFSWHEAASFATGSSTLKSMTLDDIRTISQDIGPDLKMRDLRGFAGKDIGSGRYIMQYEVEGGYRLIANSGGSDDDLLVVFGKIIDGEMAENAIDIRYYDVDTYINNGTSELVHPLP